MLRCILDDVHSEVKAQWERPGYEVVIQDYRFTLWRGPTRMIATNAPELEAMTADLRETALRRAGLEPGIPKYTWTPVQRHDRNLPELRVTSSSELAGHATTAAR